MKKPLDLTAVKTLLDPMFRLLAVCAGAALALGLVNVITAPVIREAASREKLQVLSRLAGSAARSETRAGFPLEMDQASFAALSADTTVPVAGQSLLERWYAPAGPDRYVLRRGIPTSEAAALAVALEKSAVARQGKVRAWHILKTADAISGYVLELEGSGYGGPIDIIAAYDPDGTVRSFRVLKNNESPAQGKQIRAEEYARHFAATKGAGVPVVKAMLKRPSADAVSGATISFMAVAGAVKAGSLFVSALGGE